MRATAMKIEIRSLFSWTLHFLYREECQVDVQLLSCVRLRPHELQHTRLPCPSLISWSLLKLKFIESVMPSNHLILWHPLLLPSIFPSIRVFSNVLRSFNVPEPGGPESTDKKVKERERG